MAPKRKQEKKREEKREREKKPPIEDENVIRALRKYVRIGMTMEEVAKKFGFSGWEEVYEALKRIEPWKLWAYSPEEEGES